MGAPSKRLMLIRRLRQRKAMLIERGDPNLDVPDKERIRIKFSNAKVKAQSALKKQAQKARQNITGGLQRQAKRVKSNVKRAVKARKAEVVNTAYNIYLRKQQWGL